MPDITIAFKKERDTKNKVRFQEITDNDAEPKVGTLYVSKEAMKELGDTEIVSVRLSDARETLDKVD